MKPRICSKVSLFTWLLAVAAHGAWAGFIDLRTWTQEGKPANGNWQVAADGQWVLQTVNADTTFFVSPDDYLNALFTGTLAVETTSDDDFVGFVLGYRSPLAAHGTPDNDYDFFVLDWKQATQTLSGGYTAPEGFTLARVDGLVAGSTFSTTYWSHLHPAMTVLGTYYGPGTGWADKTPYTFQLLYQADRLKIDVAGGAFGMGTTLFDLPGSFPEGRFGFYNFSQREVRYRDFTVEPAGPPTSTPEPGTWLLVGIGALGLLMWRRRH